MVVVDQETLAALSAKVEEVTGRSTDDPELERRVDNVVGRLDALHARVEEVASTDDKTTLVRRPSSGGSGAR